MKAAIKKVTATVGTMALVFGSIAVGYADEGQGRVAQQGNVMVYTPPAQNAEAMGAIDIKNAIPMALPRPDSAPRGILQGGLSKDRAGDPGFDLGAPGTGKTGSKALHQSDTEVDDALVDTESDIVPQAFGSSNHPFTTSRVDLKLNTESKTFPFSAAGKLFFNDGSTTYMCSASLIKRGVIVTAAHCVADYGQKRFYTNWKFIPALYDNTKPYGEWKVSSAAVMTSYYNGTDACAAPGVVCDNDVAVLAIAPQGNSYPGAKTGWLGYGWNGYGFTDQNLALISQLGYPYSHDKGLRMQRTDSQGFVSADLRQNTVWGGSQTGGSSGGPLLVNLGVQPSLSGTNLGSEAAPNIVVGVTAWGYYDNGIKEQGGSPFTSNNIVPLVSGMCSYYPATCK